MASWGQQRQVANTALTYHHLLSWTCLQNCSFIPTCGSYGRLRFVWSLFMSSSSKFFFFLALYTCLRVSSYVCLRFSDEMVVSYGGFFEILLKRWHSQTVESEPNEESWNRTQNELRPRTFVRSLILEPRTTHYYSLTFHTLLEKVFS